MIRVQFMCFIFPIFSPFIKKSFPRGGYSEKYKPLCFLNIVNLLYKVQSCSCHTRDTEYWNSVVLQTIVGCCYTIIRGVHFQRDLNKDLIAKRSFNRLHLFISFLNKNAKIVKLFVHYYCLV